MSEKYIVNTDVYQEIINNFSLKYPYDDFDTPVRVTVSELKQMQEFETPNLINSPIPLKRPKFITQSQMGIKLTGAEFGTLMHKFLQYADLKNAQNNLNEELFRLHEKKILTEKELKSLNKKKLSEFFKSDLFQKIISCHCEHERNFFVKISQLKNPPPQAERYKNSYLMGIIDLIIHENDELILVDYKTDYVKTQEQLINKYSLQLFLYKSALELITGKNVKSTLIYSFSLSRAFSPF
jgi:ATP-dependent helicase/nuclease subunit A